MGLIAWALKARSNVCPSGAALVTGLKAITAKLPGRFSTTNCFPSRLDILGCSIRAIRSVGPPGAEGSTSETHRKGKRLRLHDCRKAGAEHERCALRHRSPHFFFRYIRGILTGVNEDRTPVLIVGVDPVGLGLAVVERFGVSFERLKANSTFDFSTTLFLGPPGWMIFRIPARGIRRC